MSTSDYYRTRTTCRLCASADLRVAIPLRPLPVASPNVGYSQITETAPADVHICQTCGFLQLGTIVNPEFQYRNFTYVTGVSVGLREHFATLIGTLAERGEIGPGKFVFEIGSNDGSLLVLARALGAQILGIDPAVKIAKDATAAGIETIGDFFSAAQGAAIAARHGQADVVISNNTIANIDDLDDIFAGIAAVLAPKGMVVIETQYAVDMIDKTLLDVIYHEHISYFSVAPMRAFLLRHGMELYDAERIEPKGGSIRFYIQPIGGGRAVHDRVGQLVALEQGASGRLGATNLAAFCDRIADLGQRIRHHLDASRRDTGRALAYGSSVGCAALIHYFDLGAHIDAIFDDTPMVNVIHATSGPIPVLAGSQLGNEPATEVLVLAWRYMANIAAKQTTFTQKGGRFYRALPDCAFQ